MIISSPGLLPLTKHMYLTEHVFCVVRTISRMWMAMAIMTLCFRSAVSFSRQQQQRLLRLPHAVLSQQYQQRQLYRIVSVKHSSNHRWDSNMRLFSSTTTDLESKIKAKGDEIRALKESGADKATVAPLVEELLALKAQLNAPPPAAAAAVASQWQPTPSAASTTTSTKSKSVDDDDDNTSESNNGPESDFITPRAVDYSKWYNDIIRVTGLAEASPVRGCMVIKPWAMSIWDRVRQELDVKIQEHGAENAYFPLLIPRSFLSKEAEHVDGFAKECAVVTHHRLCADPNGNGLIADPEAELEDPLIIRPTSETMIWYMFRKWINSHRYVCVFVCV